ncbi:MAG: ribosomal protein S18-alanine N-acetyltransferase [Deltaproteobacteria bacterium]|jgi:ribosomal-protein-alanine N-acetyltransferase|nr:ribosomal protein S18-alanine N-acetyltransferase [Deltaproteobacteria bacterium]
MPTPPDAPSPPPDAPATPWWELGSRPVALKDLRPEPLRLSHVSKLLSLERACYSDPWTASGLERELETDHARAWGLFLDANLLAYVIAWLFSEEFHILKLTVSPYFRRLGLGEKLLRVAIGLASAEKARVVLLETHEGNLPARALYRKLGFREDGVRKNYYRNGEDAVLMSLKLREL